MFLFWIVSKTTANHANQPTESPARTSGRFKLVSAGLAFMLWGGWAWFVNSRPPIDPTQASPLLSALVQGTGSFTITLVMVQCVTWLFHRMPDNFLRLVIPAATTVCFTGSCLAAVHFLAGTSEILKTITPGMVVAFPYNVFTADQLRRKTQQQRLPAETA